MYSTNMFHIINFSFIRNNICANFVIKFVQVPLEDLQHSSLLLVKALRIRERYMTMSHQTFPTTTARFLHSLNADKTRTLNEIKHDDKMTIEGKTYHILIP